jgi:hypothetical protein
MDHSVYEAVLCYHPESLEVISGMALDSLSLSGIL